LCDSSVLKMFGKLLIFRMILLEERKWLHSGRVIVRSRTKAAELVNTYSSKLVTNVTSICNASGMCRECNVERNVTPTQKITQANVRRTTKYAETSLMA
jgi:hypothetical protein